MNKIICLLFSVFCLLNTPTLAADKSEIKTSAPTITIGKTDAPILIDEYASLGCSHCADFHLNTLPQLKATYLDSGKVKIVYHYFPLDKASVDAALLVECVPPVQKPDVVALLYKEQEKWAHDAKYQDKLKGYGAMLGLTEKTIQSCLNDNKTRDAILQGRVDANKKQQIAATPTFIFNPATHANTPIADKSAARLVGEQSFDQMAAVLNKM